MGRLLGVLLFGLAAAATALGAMAQDGEFILRAARETAPLAVVIGGLIGLGVMGRWPATVAQALILGLLSALVALVFFSASYIFGEAVIVAIRGGAPGEAVTGAVERLSARLPVAIGLGALCFTAASLTLWGLGAVGRWFSRLRHGARERKEQAQDS